MNKKLLFLLLFLLVLPSVMAKQGHVVLLAVKDTDEGYIGSSADLYLEIEHGKGRVFIETYPLSKLDTQISTRFAKDIACDYLEKDCDKYDFFYTIQSDSPIIGGPSAGGAIAVLTAAMLDGFDVDETIAMTGTINSGGLIGPVSGLKAKIDAASDAGIKKVIVPSGERFVTEKSNLTLDLVEYGEKYGIEVVEIADLSQALYEFTGKNYETSIGEFIIDESYVEVMKTLAVDICDRGKELTEDIANFKGNLKVIDDDFVLKKDIADNNTDDASELFEQGKYYSAASKCYSANTFYRELLLTLMNKDNFSFVNDSISSFEEKIDDKEIRTLADLETYIIVKERIKDARIHLSNIDGNNSVVQGARGIERFYSAVSWSKFFGVKSPEYVLDAETLENGCLRKLAEAEEQYQYANIFLPGSLKSTKEELNVAYEDLKNENFALCLFRSSKAKADANLILGAMGIGEDQIQNVIENKLNIVKRMFTKQQEKGIFPILGYSYYEFAESLKEDDEYSALLYSEYALELGNLDLYFKAKKRFNVNIDYEKLLLFISGALIGLAIGLMFRKNSKKKK